MFYLLTPQEMKKNYYAFKKIDQIIDRSLLEEESDFTRISNKNSQRLNRPTYDSKQRSQEEQGLNEQSQKEIFQDDSTLKGENQDIRQADRTYQQEESQEVPISQVKRRSQRNQEARGQEQTQDQEQAQNKDQGQASPALQDEALPEETEAEIQNLYKPPKKKQIKPKAYRLKPISRNEYSRLFKKSYSHSLLPKRNLYGQSNIFGYHGGKIYLINFKNLLQILKEILMID